MYCGPHLLVQLREDLKKNRKFSELGIIFLTPLGGGGGRIPPPHDFFDRSTLKDRKSGGHGVSKSKLLYWEDT